MNVQGSARRYRIKTRLTEQIGKKADLRTVPTNKEIFLCGL